MVVDKESDIAEGATKRTQKFYAGFHPRGGSLKGISCARGNRTHQQLGRTWMFRWTGVGSLCRRHHHEGIDHIEEKIRWCDEERGADKAKMISRDEAGRWSPDQHLRSSPPCMRQRRELFLHLSWWYFMSALKQCGPRARFQFNTKVEHMRLLRVDTRCATKPRVIHADYIVNTSGEGAAELERFVRGRVLTVQAGRISGLYRPPIKHVDYQAQSMLRKWNPS